MLPDTRFCIVEEPSPLLMKAADDTFMDDSQDSTLMDTMDESTNMSFDTEASHQGFPEIPAIKSTKKTFEDFSTPVPEKTSKKKNRKWRPPSGYILFSKESRRIINAESPDISFGEISRLVGVQWRNLEKSEKEKYEERAKRIAEEQLAKQQEATKALNDSLQGQGQSVWDITGGKGSPAPSNRPGTPGSNQVQYQAQGQQMAPPPPPPPPPRPPSPMFVSVPPRTQRLLHSEAYLRYIEGLRADKPFVSDWDKNLTATAENTNTDPNRLPSHWLAEGAGYHGNVSNALWALRDLMLKDTLNISRTLPFDAL